VEASSIMRTFEEFFDKTATSSDSEELNETIDEGSLSRNESVGWAAQSCLAVTVDFNQDNLYESTEDKENKDNCLNVKPKVREVGSLKRRANSSSSADTDPSNESIDELPANQMEILDQLPHFSLVKVKRSKLGRTVDKSRCVIKVFGWNVPLNEDDLWSWHDYFHLFCEIVKAELYDFCENEFSDLLNTITAKSTFATTGLKRTFDLNDLNIKFESGGRFDDVVWISILMHDKEMNCKPDDWLQLLDFFVQNTLRTRIRNISSTRFEQFTDSRSNARCDSSHPQKLIADRLYEVIKSKQLDLNRIDASDLNRKTISLQDFKDWADQMLMASVDDEQKQLTVLVPSDFAFPSDLNAFNVQLPSLEVIEM
jgi:hypothetical protein